MPINESYFIAITIPEPFNTEIEKLKRNISEEYGSKSVLKSPAHITIIPPFFWGNEEGLMTIVKEFSFPSFELKLRNFGFFDLGVVFIDVEENEQLFRLHQTFNALFFETYSSLKRKTLFPFQPHVTVGNRDWKWAEFTRCWADIKEKKYEAAFPYLKLSLLKNINGLWKVL